MPVKGACEVLESVMNLMSVSHGVGSADLWNSKGLHSWPEVVLGLTRAPPRCTNSVGFYEKRLLVFDSNFESAFNSTSNHCLKHI